MKKQLFLILSAILLCFGTSLIASAELNGGGSLIRYVECVVTNPNGANLYDFQSVQNKELIVLATIPYNAIITVGAYPSEEILIDGKRIGKVTYDDIFGYIDISDVKATEDVYSPNESFKINNPNTYIVTKDNGIAMYAGPSPVYDKIGTIPNGAEITLTYRDLGEKDNYANSFYYTEYNGKKGWIFKEGDIVGNNEDYILLRKVDDYCIYTGKVIITGKGIPLVNVFSRTKYLAGDYDSFVQLGDLIPNGTELFFDSYYEAGNFAPVEYNGLKGYVRISAYPHNDNEGSVITYIRNDIMTLKDCKIYSDFDKLESETNETISAYTVLPAKAYSRQYHDGTYYEWFLIDHNGTDSWLCDINGDKNISFFNRLDDIYAKTIYRIKEVSANLFKTAENGSDIAYTVSNQDKLEVIVSKYESNRTMRYVAVIGSDKAGWINDDDIEYMPFSFSQDDVKDLYYLEFEHTSETNAETGENETTAIITNAQNTETNTHNADNPAIGIGQTTNSSKTAVYIITAVIIVLTAIITFTIVKKKGF